ncbi:hypothetical protein D3C80_1116870 [compost metagenome]
MIGEDPHQSLLARRTQDAGSAHDLIALEAIDVLGRGGGFARQGQGGDPSFLGSELAIEGLPVLGARLIPTQGASPVAAGLGGAAQPVEGAALGDRGRGAVAQDLEMLSGGGRVVQLGQGDPAGEELGVDLAFARGEAVAVHGGVGGACIALLQGIQEVVATLGPQGVLTFLVRRRSGQGGQKREGLGLTTGRAQ